DHQRTQHAAYGRAKRVFESGGWTQTVDRIDTSEHAGVGHVQLHGLGELGNVFALLYLLRKFLGAIAGDLSSAIVGHLVADLGLDLVKLRRPAGSAAVENRYGQTVIG